MVSVGQSGSQGDYDTRFSRPPKISLADIRGWQGKDSRAGQGNGKNAGTEIGVWFGRM